MDASQKVESMLKSNPNVKMMNLEYMDIDSQTLQALLPKLGQLRQLEDLRISRNRLSSLPTDLSALHSVTALDISSNFFESSTDAIQGLRSMPRLMDLNLTIHQEKDEEILFSNLPNLQRLNGLELGDSPPPPGSAPRNPARREEVSMTQADLQSVALLFGAIKAVKADPTADGALTSKFDAHIQSTMEALSQTMEGLTDPFLRQSEILLAKQVLYDVCFEEIANIAASKDENFGKVVRKMRDVQNHLFKEFPGVLNEMRPHYVRKLADMQAEVVRAERETAQLLQAAEMLEKEAEAHSEQKEMMAEKFQRERAKLENANRRLRESVATKNSAPGGGGVRTKKKTARAAAAPSRTKKAKAQKPVTIRDLSLKQLKEYIDSIYESKIAFDKKCADAHLPRETMEQHMYTFLNQKYGLRSLIVEHATAIVKAVHKYGGHDNDTAVFQKIYENSIDEEFRFVQTRLKETVTELMRVYLKGKFPRKTDDAINELLAHRIKGHVYEEEWVDIVKYMYNREDSLNLTVMVKDLIRQQPKDMDVAPGRGRPRSEAARVAQRRAAAANKVKFKDFLQVLLEFQLRGHEKFLSKFRKIFRQFDSDQNGVLDEAQMRQLVLAIDPHKSKADVNKIVEMIDPYNNQHMTFSECVNVLSAELVSMMSEGK